MTRAWQVETLSHTSCSFLRRIAMAAMARARNAVAHVARRFRHAVRTRNHEGTKRKTTWERGTRMQRTDEARRSEAGRRGVDVRSPTTTTS